MCFRVECDFCGFRFDLDSVVHGVGIWCNVDDLIGVVHVYVGYVGGRYYDVFGCLVDVDMMLDLFSAGMRDDECIIVLVYDE